MTNAIERSVRDRTRADRYHDQLCRIAYLVGFYTARANHTRNPDLADLVNALDEITSDGIGQPEEQASGGQR
jgi:hypothetical protein